MGMYLMRQIGQRGVYGDPVLPDFHGVSQLQIPAVVLAGVQSLLVRARHDGDRAGRRWRSSLAGSRFGLASRGLYLSIITQALSYAMMLAFFRNDMGFGGNNGFTDFKDILGFDLHRGWHARGSCWPSPRSRLRPAMSRAG